MNKYFVSSVFLWSLIFCIPGYFVFAGVFDSHYMSYEEPVSHCCAIKVTRDIPESQVIVVSDKQLALDQARIIAMREYVINRYDCDEFSWDLRAQLYSIGIKSKVVYGKVNCSAPSWAPECEEYGGSHAWLYIPILDMYIEATTGDEIPKENLLSVYGYVEPKKVG